MSLLNFVIVYNSIRHYKSEDQYRCLHRRENFKSHLYFRILVRNFKGKLPLGRVRLIWFGNAM